MRTHFIYAVMANRRRDQTSWRLEHGTRLFRTLFISDVHLGARGCQADRLLDFLRYHDADTIYLVGDIVDGWQLRSGWYWPQAAQRRGAEAAAQGAQRRAHRSTCRAITTSSCATTTAPISAASKWSETAIHEAADGRRYLVVHGDVFDMVVKHARWLALLGDTAYDFAILVESLFQRRAPPPRLSYWSLSQWAKHKVKNAVNYIGAFEQTLAAEAHRRNVDGVICGHIHHAVDPRRFRHPLYQLRRLGRELHARSPSMRMGDSRSSPGPTPRLASASTAEPDAVADEETEIAA